MKKMKAAVIGLGSICEGHINAYRDDENTELYAVCDHDKAWLEFVKNKYEVPTSYEDYHELLKDPEIDIVSVCLPTYLHAEATIEALKAGKHVLCEKPMAINADEGRAMRDAELASGKKLMISHNQRLGEDVQVIKKIVDTGAVGELYHVRIAWRRQPGGMPSPVSVREDGSVYDRNWFNEKSRGGGVLRDLGSHLLDLTMYILDFPEIEGVYASGYRKFFPGIPLSERAKYTIDAEDMVSGFIKLKNGTSIQLEVNFAAPLAEDGIISCFYGTKMGLERYNGSVRMVYVGEDDSFAVKEANMDAYKPVPYRHPAHNFIQALIKNTPVPVPSDEGIKILEILDAIYTSASNR